MNPTSPGIQSPRYTISPNSSPSSEKPKTDYGSFFDKAGWNEKEGCLFPGYSKLENEQFKQTFDQCVKDISLKLKAMMACLLEISPKTITTPWKAFSTLVSCLGDDLPQQIPLSIFTSAVATKCIATIEDSPPAKKSKTSDSLEESTIRNKTLTSAQELANSISATLSFLQIGVQLNKLKEKNKETHQANRAFQYAVAHRFAVESYPDLDNADRDLSERIISAIAPQRDTCSYKARDQLLKNATSEFISTQELLISDTYTCLAYQRKTLPLTGKGVLAISMQYSTSATKVSTNTQWLPSWQKIIFCYLARTFLQKMNVHILDPTDSQGLLNELKPRVPQFPLTASQATQMQYATDFLAENFVQFFSKRSSTDKPSSCDERTRYNSLLQCSSAITNLLKGLFILETNMCFLPQNLSSFQKYTQTLHLPNTSETINNAVQEIANICSEEHQNIVSPMRSLLEKTSELLHKIIFQSAAIRLARKKGLKNKRPQTIVNCKWMPEELFLSTPFGNTLKEAIWAYNCDASLKSFFSIDLKDLNLMLADTSSQIKTTFHRLCQNVLMDVLKEMPSECEKNASELFFEKAKVLQTNMIPKYAPIFDLFSIVINFIAKTEHFEAHNGILEIAKQDVQENQNDFVRYTYNFLIQNKIDIPETTQALLAYVKTQYTGIKEIPLSVEKLPFWQNCIFLTLAHIFLEQQQKPIPFKHNVRHAIGTIKSYFPTTCTKQMLIPEQLKALIKALASALCLMQVKSIERAEQRTSAITLYDGTKYQHFFQSVILFKRLIQAFFKLDTGKNISQKNLSELQKYTIDLLPNIRNIYTQKITLGALSIYTEETELLDELSQEITATLATIFELLKKLMGGAVTILASHKKAYKRILPQAAITEALRIIDSDACVPESLLSLSQSTMLWKEVIHKLSKKALLSLNSSLFEDTKKMYSETASALTQFFLSLCQKVLANTSRELLLACATEKSFQKQEEKCTEFISSIYPKIVLEHHQNQSNFKNLVSFLAADALHTNNANLLTLAIKNCLKEQHRLVKLTYIYLIQQKLSLPLTTEHFLTFCKQQYRSTTPIPLTMSTLSSWDNHIFCSLAYVFLLKNQAKIAQSFHSWNPETVITHIAPFFPKVTKEIEDLPLATQIKTFQMCLAQYFRPLKSPDIHDLESQPIEVDPYACRAYENFLRSARLLKDLFKIFFTIETDKKSPSKHLQQFRSYIEKLLVNEPDLQKTNTLQDLAIIFSEEPQSLEQTILNVLWEDLIQANCLLEDFMELSLALVMLFEPTATKLTPPRAINIVLQSISAKHSFPIALKSVFTAFINSLSGTNALQKAVIAYSSGTLCSQIVEKIQILPKRVEAHSLQMTMDASLAGLLCPQIAEYTDLLSSLLLSKKEAMETLCKKLYINFKTDVTVAMPTEPFVGTQSQNFIQTANIRYATMISENRSVLPLFQAIVFILAQTCEDELQKEIHKSFDPSITTADISTTEEGPEELPDNIWKEIMDTILEEKNTAALGQESNLKTIPETETETKTEQSPDYPWPEFEELLSADDFTDLLGQGAYVLETENIEFEPEEEDAP